MKYTQISEVSDAHLSFWQSSYWKQILLDSNQAKEVFYFGNTGSTYFLVEIRSIGFGLFGAFVNGVWAHQVSDDVDTCICELKKYLKKKRIVFLQIEPIDTIDSLSNGKKPYKSFLTPYTRCLDLRLSEDELLSGMHQKGRYNIRLAQKRWVEVRPLEKSKENISLFFDLLQETTQRDGFAGNSQSYYEHFLEILWEDGRLFWAFFQWDMIAAGIFVFFNQRAIYYYGASSSNPFARRQQAPYLLQWTAIQEAKKQNCRTYDFLGIAKPENPNDPLSGVSQFKAKFGGFVETLPAKSLYPILPFRYGLLCFIRKIRQIFR